jgi:ATPase family protein associated with various cellular activities (AAA)
MRGPKRQGGADGAEPNGRHADTGETAVTSILVRDRRGEVFATVPLDLARLQADAETSAAGCGDPITLLVDGVVQSLAVSGADLRDAERAALEATLSEGVLVGHWPRTLEVTALDARSKHRKQPPPVGTLPVPARERSDARSTESPGSPSSSAGKSAPALPPELFETQMRYPSDAAKHVYDNLVGLDALKSRLVKEAIVLTQPDQLREWSRKHHGSANIRALESIRYGTPLLIFAGDVGTGKSALAESFGDAIARVINKPVDLLRMSVQTRGSGVVGDMSRQISRAFRAVEAEARRTQHITILLLDEADALAESRETQQMHHEDRAGVNALIQGLDHLRGAGIPALVVFCSNRVESVDPAVRRRAVSVVEFRRPDEIQRREHLQRLLGDLKLAEDEWKVLADVTGPRNGRPYGYTYSDIADRLVRGAVLDAFPDDPITFDLLKRIAEATEPTRPFGDAAA